MGFLGKKIFFCLCQAVGMSRPDVFSFCNSQHVSPRPHNVYPEPRRADNSVAWIFRRNFKILHPKPRPRKSIFVVNRLWDYFVCLPFHRGRGSSYSPASHRNNSPLTPCSVQGPVGLAWSPHVLVGPCQLPFLPQAPISRRSGHLPLQVGLGLWAPSCTSPSFSEEAAKHWLEVWILSPGRLEFKTWLYCFIIGSNLERVAQVLYLSPHT